MKRGDIVWYITSGHELKYGEIIRNDKGTIIVKDRNRLVRRRISQLAIKEERCRSSKSKTLD